MDNKNRIEFEKPDFSRLNQEHTLVDMHVHTRYSDGLSTVNAVAKQAKELGIGIAITDHNEIQGAIELAKNSSILSIPGIEVTSREGSHLLVYFYKVDSLKRFYRSSVIPYMGDGVMSSLSLDMEQIVRRARKYRSVIIFPHPFCAAYTGVCNLQFPKDQLDRLLEMVDGVEAINAGNLNKWNLKCTVLGFNLNKAVTGGSDAHAGNHIGRAVTYTSGNVGRRTFLDAITAQRVKVIGKEMNFFRKVTANSTKLRTSLKNYPDLMEKNIRYGVTFFNSKSELLKKNIRRSLYGKA
jgi:predicted metal-dependent phosphoesterase TrpH